MFCFNLIVGVVVFILLFFFVVFFGDVVGFVILISVVVVIGGKMKVGKFFKEIFVFCCLGFDVFSLVFEYEFFSEYL